MDPNTGNVIFIDMTEAQELIPPFSFLDKVLMRSFVAEMVALVQERFVDTASRAVMDAVAVLKSRDILLSDDAKEILLQSGYILP